MCNKYNHRFKFSSEPNFLKYLVQFFFFFRNKVKNGKNLSNKILK